MKLPAITAVDVAAQGVVVHFADGSCAFYHQSVLQQHMLTPQPAARRTLPRRKPVQRALPREAADDGARARA